MKSCTHCDNQAIYRDRENGTYLCPTHARLEVIGPRGHIPRPPLTIRPATPGDMPRILKLAEFFWHKTDIDCFGHNYNIADLPAFVACDEEHIVGVASYAPEDQALHLVMLHILPTWQGRGAASALINALKGQANDQQVSHIILATSNDNLPALGFYQRLGFTITKILPGSISEEHPDLEPGFSGIPIRDEIQMEMKL